MIHSEPVLPIKSNESIESYFKTTHRLHYYTDRNNNERHAIDIIQPPRNINIVYGLPLSGKKKISEYLSNNYGYRILDFLKITESLKKKLAGPEGNPDEVQVSFKQFLVELNLILNSIPIEERLLYINIFSIIKEKDQMIELLRSQGGFNKFFQISCNDQTIFERIRNAQGEGTEPLTDEQKEEASKTWEIHYSFIDILKKFANKTFHINNSSIKEPHYATYLNKYCQTNFIVIKHPYHVEIEKNIDYLATIHRLLVVNVPELISKIYQDPTSRMYQDLRSTYGKKKLFKSDGYKSDRERIYYEFNPIHYSPKIVNEIIKFYVSKYSSEIEESNNTVLLLGYFNQDLLKDQDLSYNLPLLEIQNLTLIGNIISFVEISETFLYTQENDIAVELEQPKPPEKKKIKDPNADGDGDVDGDMDGDKDDGDNADNMEPELNEDGTPKIIFKPEKYKWTFTDGKPRNYLQHLHKMFIFDYEVVIQEDVNNQTLQEVVLNYFISPIIKGNQEFSMKFMEKYYQDEKVLAKDVKKPRILNYGKIVLLVLKP